MERKEDLRIRKTKANLYKCFLKLIEKKPFIEITITDICKIAMINRSTFYDHYNDKYELLNAVTEDFKNDFANFIKISPSYKNNKQYFIELAKQFIDFIDQNKKRYKTLLTIPNNESIIAKKIIDIAYEEILLKMKGKYTYDYLEEVVFIYCSGVIQIIINALKKNDFIKEDY